MKQILREAMQAGAFGFSADKNLEDRTEDGSALPSHVASPREFLELADDSIWFSRYQNDIMIFIFRKTIKTIKEQFQAWLHFSGTWMKKALIPRHFWNTKTIEESFQAWLFFSAI